MAPQIAPSARPVDHGLRILHPLAVEPKLPCLGVLLAAHAILAISAGGAAVEVERRAIVKYSFDRRGNLAADDRSSSDDEKAEQTDLPLAGTANSASTTATSMLPAGLRVMR